MIRGRAAIVWLLAGCGGDGEGGKDRGSDALEPLSGCDPLVPEICALPWPSGLFEAEDPTTPTGRRLAFEVDTLPMNRDFVQVDGTSLNAKDGFSPNTPILAWLPGATDLGTIPSDDPAAYAAADAKTVIVDLETGERVPHWVEVDASARSDDQRVVTLRPAVPLARARRYAVGLRGLVRADGSLAPSSEAFLALRDGVATGEADVETRRALFDDVVFPALEGQGFARGELQLAWEFGTGSREHDLHAAISARDAALARATSEGIPYVVDSVELGDCAAGETIAKTINGHLTAGRYTDTDVPGARLVLDEAGDVIEQGTTNPAFMIRVPCSIAEDPGSGGQLLQYGHGLFGDLSEARTGHLSELANRERYVVLAMNWTGMSTLDAAWVSLMLSLDPSDFPALPERTVQGFAEYAVGLELALGDLAEDPELQFDGHPAIDRSRTPVFYGISQGAILGGAYVALSPRIERAVFGVGGGPYSLLLFRSADFGPFFRLFHEKFTDDRDIALLIGAFQTLWDPGEAAGYLDALADPLPGTPPKRFLSQVAIGDAQVTTLGARLEARAWGMSTLAPAVRPIWGVEEVAGPVEGSAIVEWEYTDGSAEPVANLPPASEGDTHECPRREPAAQEQIAVFFATGRVEQTCDGRCTGVREGFCD